MIWHNFGLKMGEPRGVEGNVRGVEGRGMGSDLESGFSARLIAGFLEFKSRQIASVDSSLQQILLFSS